MNYDNPPDIFKLDLPQSIGFIFLPHFRKKTTKIPPFFVGEVGACCTESLGTSTKSWRLQSRPSLGCCSLCRSVRSFAAGGWPEGYGVKGYGFMWKMEDIWKKEVWGWNPKITPWENFRVDVTTLAWIYFRDFGKLLAIKSPSFFRENAVFRDSLDFHPKPLRDSWFCCLFGFRSMPSPSLAEELKTNWTLVHSFRSQEDALRFIFQCQAFQYRPSGPEDFPRFQNREVRFCFVWLPFELWHGA